MGDKRKRKTRVGSGARKAGRAGKNCGRRASQPVADEVGYSFIRFQANHRWPTEESKAKRNQLDIDDRKKKVRSSPNRKPVRPLSTPLLETAALNNPGAVEKLLSAACLKMKRVRRHPGWVLQRTFKLKNRPIDLSV